jgi:hypothetical protein
MIDSETPPATGMPSAQQLTAATAKKSYTLPARRLAGSPACLNCGTELTVRSVITAGSRTRT